ncbi:helix-turn-helix transcriptional regulator [Clostridium perfringens]|uniref:helix-turn-helix transcriptional regulator n=1 Tax=Clostridium perfringens TaxID=1502 RepID=UPI002247F85E|nr:helix-turn-helix transcriptional regulator [Clostridium perfringens]MCX0353448.1 helix-turn-helix transcriptional regulator [Clostridium perfringens]
MNHRVKILRKRLGLTQEEFGKKINIGRSNLSSIESGRTNLSNRVVSDICEKFKVNEDWLRYGKGETFKLVDESDEFHEALASWLVDCDEITRKTIISLSKLNREDFNFVSRVLDGLLLEQKEREKKEEGI